VGVLVPRRMGNTRQPVTRSAIGWPKVRSLVSMPTAAVPRLLVKSNQGLGVDCPGARKVCDRHKLCPLKQPKITAKAPRRVERKTLNEQSMYHSHPGYRGPTKWASQASNTQFAPHRSLDSFVHDQSQLHWMRSTDEVNRGQLARDSVECHVVIAGHPATSTARANPETVWRPAPVVGGRTA